MLFGRHVDIKTTGESEAKIDCGLDSRIAALDDWATKFNSMGSAELSAKVLLSCCASNENLLTGAASGTEPKPTAGLLDRVNEQTNSASCWDDGTCWRGGCPHSDKG